MIEVLRYAQHQGNVVFQAISRDLVLAGQSHRQDFMGGGVGDVFLLYRNSYIFLYFAITVVPTHKSLSDIQF